MVDMSCTRCGAGITGATVAEVIAWDEEHAKVCPKPSGKSEG